MSESDLKDHDEPLTQVEYNTWLTNVKKELARYPDSIQVQAVNHLYTDTYERMESKVNAVKATLTLSEKTFNQMLFKVVK